MPPPGVGYADPMVVLYMVSAFLIAGLGSGVFLFERFGGTSRRFFLLTLSVALWLPPLGLTHGAATMAAQDLWLRIAYLFLPFTMPALYALARSMGEEPGRPPEWAVWVVGGFFAVVDAAGPWLVDGLRAVCLQGTLSGGGWFGALFLIVDLVGVVGSMVLAVISRTGAMTGEEQRERVGMIVASTVTVLPFLDYVLARSPFRAGVLTPTSLLAGTALVAFLAIRFRLFAPARTFGTDEVLRTMADGVLVCDSLGRIRSANPAVRRLLDRSRSQLVGRPVGDVVGWAEADGWRPWTALGTASTEEVDLRRDDGQTVRVSASIEPIGSLARPAGAVIVARDIRSRLKVQRALEASQRRYSSLFWHNPAVLYECDVQGRFVTVNPAAEALLGRTASQLRGVPFTEVVAPEDAKRSKAVFDAVLAGEAREYELSVRTTHGNRRMLRGVTIPIFEQSAVVGFFGVALDLTEQTRVKRELEVQRSYFADLFNSSPEGIVLLDPGTDEVLRVNEEFTRMFGYTRDETLGRKLTDLIVPEGRREEGPGLNQQAGAEGRVRAETVRQRKDGSLVDVSVLARELRIPGEPRQLYGVYRDITDRKATERALQEREEELRHAQRLEAVGKLAGGVAHDFNNLLTVINGHARLALEGAEEGEDVRDELREIERAGARAASLTQQLLAYSRRQMLHPKVLDANTVVRQLQGMLRRLIGEHILVEARYTGNDVRVLADRGQLEQVLINLVVNARDAMPEGGSLSLQTDVVTLAPDDDRVHRWDLPSGEYVRLRVADEGIGMDPATLAHAFEPFFTTKEQGKGTGLGLATVFGIVKQSDGHVVATSETGMGTVVDVYLPRVRAELGTDASADSAAEPAAMPSGTVLVVEDEAAVRKLAVKALKKQGCTVLSAENGIRALDVVAGYEGTIDLVVTDLIMPDMGGRELAAELWRRRPELPILFMSGYDDAGVQGAPDGGAFLAKPFTPAALAERVAASLTH